MNSADFAAKIKAKYPEYAGVPDADLVQKVLAKHPEYSSVVDTQSISDAARQRHAELQGQGGIDPQTGQPTYEGTGVAHEFFTGTPLGNIATGVAKGAGNTAYHLGELVKALVPGVHTDKGPNDITQALEPSNTTQRVAKGAEQVGEFMIPGAAEAGVLAPAAKIIGKLGLAGEALTQGATGAGVAAAQGDNPVVGGVAGSAAPVVAKGLVGTARAFLNGLVGASPAAFSGGANPGLSMVEEKVMGATKGGFLQGIKDAQARTMAKLNSVLSNSPVTHDVSAAINDPIDTALKNAAAYPEQAKMLTNLKSMLTDEAQNQAASGSLSKVSSSELNSIRNAVDDVRIAGMGDQDVPPAVSNALLNVSRNMNTMLDNAAPGSRYLNHQYGNLREAQKMYVQKIARGNSQTGNLALQTAIATVPAIHDLSEGNYSGAAKKAGITFALERGLTSPAVVSTAAQGMAHVAAPAIKTFAPGIASVLLGGNDNAPEEQK
jgi:hypothetical protein